MSNPRDLLPNMPGVAPAETNAQKEIKARADEELKKWNEKIRQLYLEHYTNKNPDYIYRYHFKDSFTKDALDLSGENTISAASSPIYMLADGRYICEPNRGFEIVVEGGSVRTSPKPNGRGPKAYRDAWATTFDFLKQAGATNAYVAIENFKHYSSKEIYQTAKIILQAAIHAQIGVTFDANFTHAIEAMDLEQRDKLKALQREANLSHIRRKQIIFNYYYKGHQPVNGKGEPIGKGQPGLNSYGGFATDLTEKLMMAGDDTDAKLKLIEERMVSLHGLEKFIEAAEAELQEYAQTIRDTFSDRKASDADLDDIKRFADSTHDIRGKLMRAVMSAREQAEKVREILAAELNTLSPPSEIKKPAEMPVASSGVKEALESAAVADEAGIELTTPEESSEITSDELTSDKELEEHLHEELAREELDELQEKPVPGLDVSLDTAEPKVADRKDVLDKKAETSLLAGGEGAGVVSDAAAEKAAEPVAKSEKPKLSESQDKQIAVIRDKLEQGRETKVLQERKKAFDEAVKANQAEAIKKLYDERKNMNYKP